MPPIDAFCCAFYVEEALHSKFIRKDRIEIANRGQYKTLGDARFCGTWSWKLEGRVRFKLR
jgi:hypothetical protein